MKWKIALGKFAGIQVYIHLTFFLLLIWVAASHLSRGAGLDGAISGVLFIMAIFLCVVLHEYGHALAARHFGIETKDIILLPIGGLARLERMPREPMQEVQVALAGPAVNLVIAGLLYLFLLMTDSLIPVASLNVASGPFLERLMFVNIFLLVFNLIPAFPMDGGRVLRALLAIRGNYVQATQRAAQIGQGIAFIFGLAGLLLGYPMLIFIAFFVWIGAAQESSMTMMSSAMGGIPVSQAMMTDFKVLQYDDDIGKAVSLTIAGPQNDFPVMRNDQVVGILTQVQLMSKLQSIEENSPVAEIMEQSFTTVDGDEMLEGAFRKLSECQCHTVPVLRDGRLIGLLTMDNVGEFVRIQTAMDRRRSYSDYPN